MSVVYVPQPWSPSPRSRCLPPSHRPPLWSTAATDLHFALYPSTRSKINQREFLLSAGSKARSSPSNKRRHALGFFLCIRLQFSSAASRREFGIGIAAAYYLAHLAILVATWLLLLLLLPPRAQSCSLIRPSDMLLCAIATAESLKQIGQMCRLYNRPSSPL